MENEILDILNKIWLKHDHQRKPWETLDPNLSLRKDLGFDSLDLAELTVRMENAFGVDIFETGNVDKVHEVLAKLKGNQAG